MGFYDILDAKDRMVHATIGSHVTKLGEVKILSESVSSKEKIENFLVIQGFRRNDHKVTPGLYAMGNPTEDSEVFVTANYKVSVDAFRNAFNGDGWLLILDTHGINVWCAAGKGTFGTTELVRMIKKCHLKTLLNHNRVIVPQLGAPGISAFNVKKQTGFKVVYGPVRANDINEFVSNGRRATKEMRKVTFNLHERLILTPLEFIQSMLYTMSAIAIMIIVSLIGKQNLSELSWLLNHSLALISATVIGTVIFPLCFPVLKGRKFTIKVLPLSLIWALMTWFILASIGMKSFERIGLVLFGVVLIELFALNFTGATPIASYSETKSETLKVVPFLIGTYVIGLVVFCLSIGQVI